MTKYLITSDLEYIQFEKHEYDLHTTNGRINQNSIKTMLPSDFICIT